MLFFGLRKFVSCRSNTLINMDSEPPADVMERNERLESAARGADEKEVAVPSTEPALVIVKKVENADISADSNNSNESMDNGNDRNVENGRFGEKANEAAVQEPHRLEEMETVQLEHISNQQTQNNQNGNDEQPTLQPSRLARLPTLNLPTVPRLERGQGIPLSLVALLALSSMIEVSNLYITQPLLNELVVYFNTTKSGASSLVAFSQAGYCVGLIFITPLGDAMPRRLLVLSLTAICAVLTALAALSPSIPVFQFLQFLIGLFTVVPQIVIPTVADVSAKPQMARNVGLVVGFTLVGTLYGRVVAGAIASTLSWHSVFYIATGAQVAVLLLLLLFFPHIPLPQSNLSYTSMLKSVGSIVQATPILQQSATIAFFCYISMTEYWTTTVFLMGSPVYNLPVSTIGLLGVAGIGGILAAPVSGYLPFSHHTSIALGICIQFVSQIVGLTAGKRHISVLFVAAFLCDFGRQIQQLSNQLRIYSALPLHKSRANSFYMFFGYMGTFVGVAAGTAAYDSGGWAAACGVGMGALGCAFIAWIWVGKDGRTWYARLSGRKGMVERKDEEVAMDSGPALVKKDADAGSDGTVMGPQLPATNR